MEVIKKAEISRLKIPEKQEKNPSSKILTQNTSWKNVEIAIENLNKENLIDIRKLKKIDKKKLARLIKSSGY